MSFTAALDYRKFIDDEVSIAEHSKTAGHYVIRLDPTDKDSNMFFAQTQVRNRSRMQDATYILSYSFFEPSRYPYSALGASNTNIHYEFGKQSVTFTVNAVEADSLFRIQSYLYKLYIAKDFNNLRTAVQC